MSNYPWPYNLPIFRAAHRATSPNLRIVAEIGHAGEVAMSAPTSGTLWLSSGLLLDQCNPSFVWSADSRYLAVPRFFNRFGLFRRQRMIVVDTDERRVLASRETAAYFMPLSFSRGVLTVTKNPAGKEQRMTWQIPADLDSFEPVTADWGTSLLDYRPDGYTPMHRKDLEGEVAAAGGLDAALGKAFAWIGSALRATMSEGYNEECPSCEVAAGNRGSRISMIPWERQYHFDFWRDGVCFGLGRTPNIKEAVRAVHRWMVDACSVNELADFGWVQNTAHAGVFDQGLEVEGHWISYLEFFSEIRSVLAEFVVEAAQEPRLRELFPHTCGNCFRVSLCTGYPYTENTPIVRPERGGSYSVLAANGQTLGQGDAASAVQLVVQNLPPDCGRAIAGTAMTVAASGDPRPPDRLRQIAIYVDQLTDLLRDAGVSEWRTLWLIENVFIEQDAFRSVLRGSLHTAAEYADRFDALMGMGLDFINLRGLGLLDDALLVAVEVPHWTSGSLDTAVNYSGPASFVRKGGYQLGTHLEVINGDQTGRCDLD